MNTNLIENDNFVFRTKDLGILTDTYAIAKLSGRRHRKVRETADSVRGNINSLYETGNYPSLKKAKFYEYQRYDESNHQTTRDILMTERAFDHVVTAMKGTMATAIREWFFNKFDELKLQNEQLKKQSLNRLDDRDAQTLLTDNDDLRKNLYKKEKKLDMINDNYDRALDKNYYYDKQMATNALYTVSKIATEYGTSATKFDKALQQAHILYKQGYDFYLYAKYRDSDLVAYRTMDGQNSCIHFTEAGRKWLYTVLKNRFKVTPLGMTGIDFESFYPFNHTYGEKCKQLTLNKDGKNGVEA